ncbi:hypothetical protein PMM47T1_12918 [Pseudomonas sp. M47T1]|uniref:hypothetical protein n=1 Tax=unclassified Pseudomonas TaxID=196821 RepID=UPI000260789E|nr:hypothetical protein [Pseudomonas sp. M47T1]EIK96194.1 hypothetical protein PMM47T1_12918 [Pseudomonas sp. M47T1]
MPRGSKDKYTAEQRRKAEHIEERYEDKGLSKSTAEARAWATVNKQSGGGEKAGGSGRHTSATRKASATSDSAKRAAQSRAGHPRSARSSLGTQTKASLMSEARSRNLRGRSTMTKAELIEALHHPQG